MDDLINEVINEDSNNQITPELVMNILHQNKELHFDLSFENVT